MRVAGNTWALGVFIAWYARFMLCFLHIWPIPIIMSFVLCFLHIWPILIIMLLMLCFLHICSMGDNVLPTLVSVALCVGRASLGAHVFVRFCVFPVCVCVCVCGERGSVRLSAHMPRMRLCSCLHVGSGILIICVASRGRRIPFSFGKGMFSQDKSKRVLYPYARKEKTLRMYP